MSTVESNANTPKPTARPRPKPVTLTDAAAERISAIIAKSDGKATMLKISVDSKGCSGHSYVLDYANVAGPLDEKVEDKGVTILIDPKAALFIFGTEIDYVTEKLKSGFTFKNPNETGRCGCGESFSV
ncbi:MAG TPA: iron-sulfur cluster assembly accessory protein [Alphaproteobacteria bacterium]|nr:iron-sulfur cluster assembly accessory protein [Alphaproteobacteria bacterium]